MKAFIIAAALVLLASTAHAETCRNVVLPESNGTGGAVTFQDTSAAPD